MGGFGSGWWTRHAATPLDRLLPLDIRYLRQHGYLRPGPWRTLAWVRGEEETARMHVAALAHAAVVRYCYQTARGDWVPVTVPMALTWTPCHYGGSRPWFRCPQCTRRVAVLYMVGPQFVCRHCCGLPYASQQQDYATRMAEQARKIRQRLGASPNLCVPVGWRDKPPGMHGRTFAALLRREARYRHAALAALGLWLGRMEAALAAEGLLAVPPRAAAAGRAASRHGRTPRARRR
jgi:hypothetical protein